RITTLDLPDNTEFETIHQGSPVGITDANLFAVSERASLIHGEAKSRITQIRMDSAYLNVADYEGQFDLIYIDASHSYSAVKADSEKALKMLSPEGVIIWDDYNYPGIWRYLNELARMRPDLKLRYIEKWNKVLAGRDRIDFVAETSYIS